MLSKDKRLNLKKDFSWVASGKKLESKFLKLFIKYGEDTSPKIGIALSGKSFKTAVLRNKAKRLTSFAFEQIYNNLPNSINIVALPKRGILEVKSDLVFEDLSLLITNEKIINIAN